MSQFGKPCARRQQVLMMDLGKAPPPSVIPRLNSALFPRQNVFTFAQNCFPSEPWWERKSGCINWNSNAAALERILKYQVQMFDNFRVKLN